MFVKTLTDMYRFYGLLTGSNQTSSGVSIIPGIMLPAQRHFGPLMPAHKGCLAVEITPDVHDPKGRYTESATIRVYDPAEHTLTSDAEALIELQGLFSPDPQVPSGVMMFQQHRVDPARTAPFFEALARFQNRPSW